MEVVRTPRRISASKESRLALLAQIREAKEKGEKLRIETTEKAVYETVDEAEYAKIVQQRLEDDWIVEDVGEGYVDTGREIFDDSDGDEELSDQNQRTKRSKKTASISKKPRLNPDIRAENSSPSLTGRDIRSWFNSTSAQRSSAKDRKERVGIASDPGLDDLLAELEHTTPVRTPHYPSLKSASNSRKSLTGQEKMVVTPFESRTRTAVNKTHVESPSHKKERCGWLTDEPKSTETSPNTSRSRNPFSAEKSMRMPIKHIQGTNEPLKKDSSGSKESDHISSPKPSAMEMKPEIIASDIGQSVTAQPDEVFLNPPTPSDMETHISFEPELSDSDWFAGDNETLAPMETWTTQMDILDTSSVVGKNRLLFYWFDAYEDSRHQAGVVYLFGKVGDPNCSVTRNTCCLRIKDLERRVYLLPRPELVDSDPNFSMKDVYAEFRDISVERKIGKFRCKPSTKRYAFELPDVPIETEYLEVRYSAAFPSLPSDLQGKTFSRIFGTNTSFLENLILDLQLRGPCWLVVDSATPVQPQFSWCNSDYEVSWRCDAQCPLSKLSTLVERASADRGDSNKTIPSLPPSPPLCLVAINIKAVTQPQANHSEIISIGLLIDHTYSLDRPLGRSMFQSHYLVLGCPKDAALPYDLRTKLPNFGEQYAAPAPNWPNNQPSLDDENHSAQARGGARRIVAGSVGGIDVEPNERALLARFLTRLHRLDPDLLVGHDLWGHQIELLIQRLIANKVPHWHRVGRLRRSAQFVTNANSRAWLIRNAIPGRLVCDTLISARELVRSRTYNLSDLAGQVLAGSTGSSAARRKIPEPLLRFLHKTTHVSNDDLLGFDLTDFDIDSADLRCLFTSSELVKQLIDFCLSDAHLALRLAHQLQILPLAMQITSICGNVLSRTLSGGRAERNEALLLHAFTQHGYIVPDPPVYRRGKGTHDEVSEALEQGDELQTSAGRRKPAYTGGLVLEPKKGFYDKYILLLDFNSLYPSIIQEFNVCFTTVDRELVTGGALSVGQSSESEMASERTGSGPLQSKAFDLDSMVASLLSSVHGASAGSSTTAAPDPLLSHLRLPTSQAPGLLPAEIRRLVESRKEVKKLIATTTSASPLQLAQWNTRQAALKLTANSVYGCLGFAASRFFARGLAALVTGLGRAVLMNTRDLVERMNLEVIYGDTDSIMINTNTTDLLPALTIGERVRQEVNKHYRLLELDTDGVYSAMLLLAKKKYAALAINDPVQWASAYRAAQAKNITIAPPTKKQELKGLDIVRRDWSALAVNVGRRCVAALLSGDPKDVILERIHTDLSETADKVKQGQLPMSDFIITRMLTKDPEDYADAKSLPHVQVALRLNHSNSTQSDERNPTGSTRRFRAGDTVEYIICNDGSNSAATQRGYSPSELADQERNKLANTTNTPVLSVDVNYYLAHQIHPVVCRLVSPIEGTSPARIADCLGLDPSGYQRQGTALTGVDEDDEIVASEGAGNGFSSWGDVDPLIVSCPAKCGGPPLEIKPISLGVPTKTWTCSHCSHNVFHSVDSIRVIVNRLTVLARQCIVRYQLGWLRCEDPACDLISRSIHCPPSFMGIHGESDGLWARGCRPLCPGCGGLALLKAQYTEGRLYRQLCFYRHLISTALKLAAESYAPPSLSRLLQQSRSHFDRLLSHSAFAMVDLSQLFSGLRGVSSTAA